jgi:hypothetical protein
MRSVVSEHRYPRPLVRRIASCLVAVGSALAVVSIAVEIFLALFVSPLLCGIAFFTAILAIPLLQRSVLHPEISVVDGGLSVQPMIWRAQFVPWDSVAEIVTHPLVYNDEAMGRLLHGKGYRPRQGIVVIVKPEAGLWPVYRLVGALAGAGNRPGFALSSTTHTDYETLVQTIQAFVMITK